MTWSRCRRAECSCPSPPRVRAACCSPGPVSVRPEPSLVTRSPSASPPAIRQGTGSCCGPGSPSTRSGPDGQGGMPTRDVDVEWELALDERFAKVVRKGTETARWKQAHSVHAEPDGLEPGTEYFYRFRAGGHLSRVGRTRTAPAAMSLDDPGHRRLRPLRARLLHGVQEAGRAGPGPGRAPGRLHVRVRAQGIHRPRRERPPPHPRQVRHAGRLPAAARAVQERRRPADGARGRALAGRLRRPRDREQLGR